jgi:hypothetical protein
LIRDLVLLGVPQDAALPPIDWREILQTEDLFDILAYWGDPRAKRWVALG